MEDDNTITGSTFTIVAGIPILWKSNNSTDIEKVNKTFQYHLCDISGWNKYHTVEFKTMGNPVQIPNDAITQWEGHYVGLMDAENMMTWYHSQSTKLDYLVLSNGCTIIHDRENSYTECLIKFPRKLFSSKPRRSALEVENTFVVLIHTVASMYNRYTIHGAAVAYNGYAHVFLGSSGSGKSTLSSDLLKQGAEFMGDDLVFFYLEDGKVMVGSLLLEVKLTSDDDEKLNSASVENSIPSKHKIHKRHFDIIKERNVKYTHSAPAKSISLIKQIKPHRGQKSYLEAQEPIDAIIHLFRGSNNPLMQYDPEQWQNVFQTAAETLPYSIFHFGDRKLLDISILDETSFS